MSECLWIRVGGRLVADGAVPNMPELAYRHFECRIVKFYACESPFQAKLPEQIMMLDDSKGNLSLAVQRSLTWSHVCQACRAGQMCESPYLFTAWHCWQIGVEAPAMRHREVGPCLKARSKIQTSCTGNSLPGVPALSSALPE